MIEPFGRVVSPTGEVLVGRQERRLDLLGLALELSVPPLSLLVLAWVFFSAALTVCWIAGAPGWPAALAIGTGAIGAAALLSAWWRFGRQYLSAAGLALVPVELASRFIVLCRFLVRPQGTWVRTARRTGE